MGKKTGHSGTYLLQKKVGPGVAYIHIFLTFVDVYFYTHILLAYIYICVCLYICNYLYANTYVSVYPCYDEMKKESIENRRGIFYIKWPFSRRPSWGKPTHMMILQVNCVMNHSKF